jgi:hypothetical protein
MYDLEMIKWQWEKRFSSEYLGSLLYHSTHVQYLHLVPSTNVTIQSQQLTESLNNPPPTLSAKAASVVFSEKKINSQIRKRFHVTELLTPYDSQQLSPNTRMTEIRNSQSSYKFLRNSPTSTPFKQDGLVQN